MMCSVVATLNALYWVFKDNILALEMVILFEMIPGFVKKLRPANRVTYCIHFTCVRRSSLCHSASVDSN